MKKLTEEESIEKAVFNLLSKKMEEVCPEAILSFDIELCEDMKDYISDIRLDIESHPDKATIINNFNEAVDKEIRRLKKEKTLKNKKNYLIMGEINHDDKEMII